MEPSDRKQHSGSCFSDELCNYYLFDYLARQTAMTGGWDLFLSLLHHILCSEMPAKFHTVVQRIWRGRPGYKKAETQPVLTE
jgi:hypothetical protein